MRYAAVVAAAGISSRMKEFKPMLALGEETIISSVINNLRCAGAEEIVVVTGYRSDVLRRYLSGKGVRICENADYASTKMFDSICMGLRALQQPYDIVLLTPGDVPLVQMDTIDRMKEAGAPVVRPVCDGRLGHPVMVSAECVPMLLDFRGEGGLKGAVESLGLPIANIVVQDRGVIMDADTPEDFQALRQQAMENRSGGRLWADIQVHIGKGDAVLTPETAQFLEMIDHTGSIQSACACVHISYTKGWRLLNRIEKALGYPLVERYPGGASGGGSRLTERGKRLLDTYQQYRDEVRAEADRLFRQMFPGDLHG